MKKRMKDLTSLQRIETLDALYTAAASVKGRDAVKRFLKDLFTDSERIMLGRRILIARKIIAHERYETIEADLGVGRDTIVRVHKWLRDQLPGYEVAVAGLEREYAARKKKADDAYMYATSALYRLKKKYPLHFLLFPWPTRRD